MAAKDQPEVAVYSITLSVRAKRVGDFDADRLGSFEVDHKIETGGLVKVNFSRCGAISAIWLATPQWTSAKSIE
jgi:hypothetical protein